MCVNKRVSVGSKLLSRLSFLPPQSSRGLLRGKISTCSHLGIQKRALCSSGRAPASLSPHVSPGPHFPDPPPYIGRPLPPTILRRLPLALGLARARALARACLARVSAYTYIRYLRAYIWVPIYRYQMVNERVDARSGRPQLAATQSFVYRGAVCATAHTGWPRSVDIFPLGLRDTR